MTPCMNCEDDRVVARVGGQHAWHVDRAGYARLQDFFQGGALHSHEPVQVRVNLDGQGKHRPSKGLEMMGIVEGILVTDRLHEPRLHEAPLDVVGVRGQDIDVDEPSSAERIEFRNLRAFEEDQRWVAQVPDARYEGRGGEHGGTRGSLLFDERRWHRRPSPPRVLRGERADLVREYVRHARRSQQRFDGFPEAFGVAGAHCRDRRLRAWGVRHHAPDHTHRLP